MAARSMVFTVILLLGPVERLADIAFTVQRKLAKKHPDENSIVVACSVERNSGMRRRGGLIRLHCSFLQFELAS
jgi:hypothetical protein